MKARARRGQPIGFVRPAELRQQRRRIEDAAPDTLGPIQFDQPHQAQLVDVRVRGRGRIEQQHAVRSGARRERLTFNPPPHGAGQPIDRERRVVVAGLRVGQRLERADDRGARTLRVAPPRRPRPSGWRSWVLTKSSSAWSCADAVGASRNGRSASAAATAARSACPGVGARPATRALGAAVALAPSVANEACPTSAPRRSHPPKYFSSRSRASSAFTRALTDTSEPSSSGNRQCGELEQIDGRGAVRRRDDEREDHVERPGERLGGERQRVERLIRTSGVGEHRARQVEVRQRALEHDGRPVGVARRGAHERDELLLPVAADEPAGRRVRCRSVAASRGPEAIRRPHGVLLRCPAARRARARGILRPARSRSPRCRAPSGPEASPESRSRRSTSPRGSAGWSATLTTTRG